MEPGFLCMISPPPLLWQFSSKHCSPKFLAQKKIKILPYLSNDGLVLLKFYFGLSFYLNDPVYIYKTLTIKYRRRSAACLTKPSTLTGLQLSLRGLYQTPLP